MKIGVMMSALRERKMIVPAIRQFDNMADELKIDEIVVACSSKSWFGDVEGDDTAALAAMAGATVRRFYWTNEADQKNWIMSKMQDKDWVLLFAPDMYMTTDSLNNVAYFLKNADKRAYACGMQTYFRDYENVTQPYRNFNNFAIRPNELFKYSSLIDNAVAFDEIPGSLMHHLSFVRTPEEMKIKISTWSHAPEVLNGWYEKWLNFKPGDKFLGITDKMDIIKTIEYPLPKEIRDLIERYKCE